MATAGQKRTRSERVAALALPPGAWQRTWTAMRRRHVLLRLALTLTTAVLLCAILRGWDPPFSYRAGESRSHDVVARVPFEVVDAAGTELARDQARRQVRYVYKHDPQPLVDLVAELRARVGEVLAAESYADLNPQLWAEFQPPSDKAVSRLDYNPQKRFEAVRRALANDKNLAEFDKSLQAALTPYLQFGMMERPQQKPGEGHQEEITVYPVGQPEAKKVAKLADVLLGKDAVDFHDALSRQLKSPEVADAVFDWLRRHRLPTTLALDQKETEQAVTAAVANVKDVIVRYEPGQTLAEARRPLTADQIAVLRAEYNKAMQQRSFRDQLYRALAVVGFILGLFGLAAMYVFHREPQLLVSLRRTVLMQVLGIVTVVVGVWAANDERKAELIPLLLFGQTVAIAYTRELALLFAGVLAMILMMAIGHNVNTLVLLTGVAAAAVLQLGRIRSRTKLIYVGILTGVAASLLTLVLGVLDNQTVGPALLKRAGMNGLWCVVAGFIMTGLLPFIERAFHVLTDISLLELGDVAHPLLQELVRRAPSTYNHSITVGTIAEAAAEAIGARGLLVRVGAYFHDIGKMLKPGYFIENQSAHENRHDALMPAMSSLVIIAHIKDGSDLARQHALPQPIVDLIEQHHGTTLVEYFFGRATEQLQKDPNGGEVDESSFRYPGPRPQTKEAAVLMLADAVESACRSLVEPGPARIESLVREIAERKLDDGQFDESNLTLRELRTIEDSMIKSLIANYHGRIKYPEPRTAGHAS